LLAWACSATAAIGADYAAVIGEGRARFSFPAPTQRVWTWDRENSEHASLEYGWSVRFTDGNALYALGVQHFKQTGVEPTEGTLDDLLAICQKDLWVEKGGVRNRLEGDMISVDVVDGRLALEVSAPSVLGLLRAAEGRRVIFETWRYGRLIRQKWVRIASE
jgi:hypothetical protein